MMLGRDGYRVDVFLTTGTVATCRDKPKAQVSCDWLVIVLLLPILASYWSRTPRYSSAGT